MTMSVNIVVPTRAPSRRIQERRRAAEAMAAAVAQTQEDRIALQGDHEIPSTATGNKSSPRRRAAWSGFRAAQQCNARGSEPWNRDAMASGALAPHFFPLAASVSCKLAECGSVGYRARVAVNCK
jgi:hypothetical protein